MHVDSRDWQAVGGGLVGLLLGVTLGYLVRLDLLVLGAVGLVLGVAVAVSRSNTGVP
ncbi:hypothetical protein ACKVMT_06055 [Halobacteriales archaeon Cl-PHB]